MSTKESSTTIVAIVQSVRTAWLNLSSFCPLFFMNKLKYLICETSGIKQQLKIILRDLYVQGIRVFKHNILRDPFTKEGYQIQPSWIERTIGNSILASLFCYEPRASKCLSRQKEWWRQLPSYVYTFCVRYLTPRKFFTYRVTRESRHKIRLLYCCY